jgi:hypothetical protein
MRRDEAQRRVTGQKERSIFVQGSFVSCLALLLAFFLFAPAASAQMHQGHDMKGPASGSGGKTEKVEYPAMAGPGKKVSMGNDFYIIYGFDKKPKLGNVIMKVEIFDRKGTKNTSFEVKAEAGMPSMKGAHETGEQAFALSKKGDYLLPINIVMPGEWEVRISISKEGKTIFRGSHRFDV